MTRAERLLVKLFVWESFRDICNSCIHKRIVEIPAKVFLIGLTYFAEVGMIPL